LKALLDESAAYRSYYSRADKDTLVEAASYNQVGGKDAT